MWYLCAFYHRLLDYRKPEVESLADLFGAFNKEADPQSKSLEWRLPENHHPDSPFHFVNLPSEEIARQIANRRTLQQPCSLENIEVAHFPTWRLVQGHDEWRAVVINTCNCSQSNITLYSPAYRGVAKFEPLDPSVLLQSGDYWLLHSGLPLPGNSSFSFNYVSGYIVDFTPFSSNIHC